MEDNKSTPPATEAAASNSKPAIESDTSPKATSTFDHGKLIIHRMSAPTTHRTTASIAPREAKMNPKKRLAGLAAPYRSIQAAGAQGHAPTDILSTNKRKPANRNSVEHEDSDGYEAGDEREIINGHDGRSKRRRKSHNGDEREHQERGDREAVNNPDGEEASKSQQIKTPSMRRRDAKGRFVKNDKSI